MLLLLLLMMMLLLKVVVEMMLLLLCDDDDTATTTAVTDGRITSHYTGLFTRSIAPRPSERVHGFYLIFGVNFAPRIDTQFLRFFFRN